MISFFKFLFIIILVFNTNLSFGNSKTYTTAAIYTDETINNITDNQKWSNSGSVVVSISNSIVAQGFASASAPSPIKITSIFVITLLLWTILFLFGNLLLVLINQFKNNNKRQGKASRTLQLLNNSAKPNYSFLFQALSNLKYVNVANLSLILLHSLFAIIAGIITINGPFNLGMTNTPFQNQVLSISISFMIIDLITMYALGNRRKDFVFHHLICIAALGYSLLTNKSGWELSISIAIGEMGPFFYIENLAKKLNIKSKKFYFYNNLLYIIVFPISRIFLMSFLGHITIVSSNPTIIIKIMAITFLMIGYYWSFELFKKNKDLYLYCFCKLFMNDRNCYNPHANRSI